MTELVIGDLRTGEINTRLPFSRLNWSKSRNTAETIRCTVPITNRLRKIGMRNVASLAKSYLAVIENDIPIAAGPVWRRRAAFDGRSLELSAAGIWSYFDHRVIVKLLADSVNVIDPATGESLAAADTNFVNLSYGTMVKRLIQESMLWTGGNLPFVFLPDELGTYVKSYSAANLTKMGEAFRNFTKLVNGIDIEFRPQRTADRLGIEWLVMTGSLAQPELHGPTVHRWDLSVPKPRIKGLVEVEDAANMTAQAWATGGRQSGEALVERARNYALTDAGYPFLQSVDSSHSDVSESDTLLQYAQNELLWGRAPRQGWQFQVRGDTVPILGSYQLGDYADIVFPTGHWWFDAGTKRTEIATMSGTEDARWVSITTEEVLSA